MRQCACISGRAVHPERCAARKTWRADLMPAFRYTGRNAQGVRLMSMGKGDIVTSVAKLAAKEEEQ